MIVKCSFDDRLANGEIPVVMPFSSGVAGPVRKRSTLFLLSVWDLNAPRKIDNPVMDRPPRPEKKKKIKNLNRRPGGDAGRFRGTQER
jgi:hypothetical protein